MESIKEALDKARSKRGTPIGESPSAGRRGVHSNDGRAKRPDLLHLERTATRPIKLPVGHLQRNRLISSFDDPLANYYKTLRTRVVGRMRPNNWRSLALTSPTRGCGKTTTAINLAMSIAMDVNQTVMLVDVDLRRPSVLSMMTGQNMPGIADYLKSESDLSEYLFYPEGFERLVVLPGSHEPVRPSELIASPPMAAFAREVSDRYPDRLIIYDLPPLLVADDVLAFAPLVDSFLMITAEGLTTRADLETSRTLIEDQNILGTVMNKSRGRARETYDYY